MNKKNINEKKLMILIMIVVVLIVIFAVMFNILFSGARGIAKDYAKGMKNFDSKLIVDLYMDEMIKESYESREDMMKEYDAMFKEMEDGYSEVLRYKIDDNYKLYEGNEYDYQVKKLKEDFKISPEDVKEIRRYTIIFECNYDSELKEVENKILVGKIKSKWYLIGLE